MKAKTSNIEMNLVFVYSLPDRHHGICRWKSFGIFPQPFTPLQNFLWSQKITALKAAALASDLPAAQQLRAVHASGCSTPAMAQALFTLATEYFSLAAL
jgi:hypothetical protein